STGDDLTIRLWKWDTTTRQYLALTTLGQVHSRTIYSLSFSWPLIATCGGDNAIVITRVADDGSLHPVWRQELAHGEFDLNCVEWCPVEGLTSYLASGGDDSQIKIWKMNV
ncbi:Cytosolic iron-sulfur protein assembly protein, partial [Kappamyces sp. JEL0680]